MSATATMRHNWPDIPGYEVQAEIGRGGMGVVYRVRQRESGHLLALKMILHGRGSAFVELARFRIEAEALACLNHPNIVNIRDVGLYNGHPFFTLDFAEGGSLKQTVARGPQRPRWSAELVRTVALAMQHAHDRGMLHRDLKPANVLLMGDGTPKVSDFGLVKFANPISDVSAEYCTLSVSVLDTELSRFARELGAQYDPTADAPGIGEDELTLNAWEQCAARTGLLGDGSRLQSIRAFLDEAKRQSRKAAPSLDGLTHTGAVMGSPGYMAPEQATGDLREIGPATDVYALGGILYELLTGRPPFRSESLWALLQQVRDTRPIPPRELAPGISADIEAVCLKCLEKSPGRRYPSASALAEDLNRFNDGYSPHATANPSVGAVHPALCGTAQELPSTLIPDADAPTERPASTRSWWPFGRNRSGTVRGAVRLGEERSHG